MAHNFQPGDLAVVESPVYHHISADALRDHRSLAPGARVRVHAPSSVRPDEVVIDLADGRDVYRGCWRILAEGLIPLTDVDLLAAQRAPLAKGDRVAIASPIYRANGTFDHSEEGDEARVGDTAVVHNATPDGWGDIYVRNDRTGRLVPIAREGLVPLDADVLALPTPEDTADDLPTWEDLVDLIALPDWEDLDEASRTEVEMQDAEERIATTPLAADPEEGSVEPAGSDAPEDVRAWALAVAADTLVASYTDLGFVAEAETELDDEAFARALVTLATYIEKGA